MTRRRLAILLLCLASMSMGCASKKPPANEKLNLWLARQAIDLPQPEYRVNPPDVLEIIAPGIDELNEHKSVIRPDGRISLSLVGEIFVSGMTPAEIAAELRKRAAPFYAPDKLDITVRVAEYKSKVFYVFGHVDQPGTKPFTGGDTIVAVLAQARLNEYAWPQKVVIVRPNDDVMVRQKVTVDLKAMYESGNLAENYVVEEGDVIYIPPSPLADLNMKVNKVVMPLIPSARLVPLLTGAP